MTCSTSWKSTQGQYSCLRGRTGETSLTCRGQRAWHIWREVAGTRETHPGTLLHGVVTRALPYNRKGGGNVTGWESDSLIVLGDRESLLRVLHFRRQGEGVNEHA